MNTPCENPSCGRGYWMPDRPVAPERREQIEQPARGRRRRFCSDACKMMVYRADKAIKDMMADRRRREAHHASKIDQVERVVALVLAEIPSNSRVSTTQRKALAERVARQLALASLIDYS